MLLAEILLAAISAGGLAFSFVTGALFPFLILAFCYGPVL